jgi:hypothetical protein
MQSWSSSLKRVSQLVPVMTMDIFDVDRGDRVKDSAQMLEDRSCRLLNASTSKPAFSAVNRGMWLHRDPASVSELIAKDEG